MDEERTLKTLIRLIELDTRAVKIYDQALSTLTDPVIRRPIEDLKARHNNHAEQLSSEILKITHKMIAEHWDAITCAALQAPLPKSCPKQ